MIQRTNAEAYCSEDISKIENYEQAVNDKTQMWDCHHKLEIQGQFRNSTALLKRCGMYYNVPAWQLIFLTHGEHAKLHRLGGHLSKETKKKMSLSNSGEKNPMFGKHHSEETRKKMSMSQSGKSPWNKGKHLSMETKKRMSMSHSGKFCGEKNPMFGKHHSEETRKKMSMSLSGKHLSAETRKKLSDKVIGMKYWNNGSGTKRSKECPGEGWVRGRLKRK